MHAGCTRQDEKGRQTRYADDFLDSATETLNVIVPIEDLPDVKVRHGRVTQPPSEEVLLDVVLCLENSNRNSTLADRGPFWLFGDDKLAVQSLSRAHEGCEKCQGCVYAKEHDTRTGEQSPCLQPSLDRETPPSGSRK